jgi:ferredoxin
MRTEVVTSQPADPDGSVVRVEPSDVAVEVQRGETLMAAAERQGYRWPTICHGQALCTACFIIVDDDPAAFEPPGPLELNGLSLFEGRSFYEGKTIRLACQARPVKDTVVTKRGVRRVEPSP